MEPGRGRTPRSATARRCGVCGQGRHSPRHHQESSWPRSQATVRPCAALPRAPLRHSELRCRASSGPLR
eukprot:5886168-Alexandrium_andersonii.AAC.1